MILVERGETRPLERKADGPQDDKKDQRKSPGEFGYLLLLDGNARNDRLLNCERER